MAVGQYMHQSCLGCPTVWIHNIFRAPLCKASFDNALKGLLSERLECGSYHKERQALTESLLQLCNALLDPGRVPFNMVSTP